MSGPSFGTAARILAERDPVIARLAAEAGPPRLSRPTESHFGTLVRAIVYQQLEQDGVAAGPGGQGARRDRGAVPARAGPGERRRDRRAAVRGARHRAVDGGDVPDLPAAPAGRLAGRRPRRPPRLRAGLAGPRADRAGAQAARRAVPALPVGRGLVLLAGRGTVRGRGGQRADPVNRVSVPGPRPPSSAATRRCSVRPSSLSSAARAWPSTRAPGRRACTSCPAGSGCRRASTPGTAGTVTC